MTGNDRQSPTWPGEGPDNEALVTLDVVSARFEAAGLPRSLRTLQRYCGNGTLDCLKEATETGDTYFIREPSIDPAITALKQLHAAKDGHRPSPTQRAASLPDAPVPEPLNSDDADRPSPTMSDNAGAEAQENPSTTDTGTPGYVAQLETRLEEKDDEIAFLREELVERRTQVRDMKGIIDGQNQLLEVINRNVAPIFKALAGNVAANQPRLPGIPPTTIDHNEPNQHTL